MIAATMLLGCALLAVAMLARVSGLMGRFARLAATGRRSVRIMGYHGASDFSRERAARILAGRMMTQALMAGAMLVVVALPLVAAIALDGWTGVPTRAALADPGARLTILAIGVCLVVTRSVIVPKLGRRTLVQPRLRLNIQGH
ncbi:hypothetical protein [Novosphingobium sp.]|uniref:hypothetical protein n=1 Tax=Novosphingobium sp. TaxID=1874826 RepID=UPI003D0B4C74